MNWEEYKGKDGFSKWKAQGTKVQYFITQNDFDGYSCWYREIGNFIGEVDTLEIAKEKCEWFNEQER